jgi:methylene-fatty-acyl-phospholipid synthase
MGVFLAAALLLSFERLAYLWIWHRPDQFRALAAHAPLDRVGSPVDLLQLLFLGFKAIQAAVFVAWCWWWGCGDLWAGDADSTPRVLGAALLVVGQALNLSVFRKLGRVGVFYGNRLGYDVPWCRGFPFSVLRHPQYTGAVLSIWGFFLVMRFPHADWFWLPALETLYYAAGARLER